LWVIVEVVGGIFDAILDIEHELYGLEAMPHSAINTGLNTKRRRMV
jgi:hypothetical protein